MKFKLSIDPHQEEFVHAHLKQKDKFSAELEQFVLNNGQDQTLIAFDEDKNLVNLSAKEVSLVTIIDNKTYILTNNNQRLVIKARLYQVAEKLPNYFWKINKSSIVNRYQIKQFNLDSGAGINVTLKTGINDYVSRRCFAKIRKELK